MASSLNGFQGSYNQDRPSSAGSGSGMADVDNSAIDPASSSFLSGGADPRKHDDLKKMLDTNKDALKLEAMKRIIGMVAKGKDASDLFPAVVKNVVCKNIEVKKLVYVYLTRYAEEQQDLALLSISTFQRALKDPNQLIRASALRVLSSIRVPVIVPIMMLAIKDGVSDMSPYVRKTAAHAIGKLYSLDPEQKDELVVVIERLLADKTTLVAGSAIAAFEDVCPERIDLIHKNFRKLCGLLVDVEEWGQVSIISMLTRYARTQFLDPCEADGTPSKDMNDPKNFYEDGKGSEKSSDEEGSEEEEEKKIYVMDQDHSLLLRTCKPLLNSRNASVVLSVVQLYYHCAPRSELVVVAKALIRSLRSHKEVQYIVLCNIATMSLDRREIFEPYLKSFYVRSSDPLQVKLLKLEILTNLATESSTSTILREFQTYVKSNDSEFAAATIQAIGRCASGIPEVTEACLNGLVRLLSNRNGAVVAESVVVIKKLLQMQPTEHKDILLQLARLTDNIAVPAARASILWLLGEYADRVPKIAPDVLRKAAKTFGLEEDIVKLQIVNLAAKLCLTNPKQTKVLCQYVLQLAKYDLNYDLRDRARFLRALLFPQEGGAGAQLSKHAKKILLWTKPAPLLTSKFKNREEFQLATLSHLLNTRASGYSDLPQWPQEAPDPSVRVVEVAQPWREVQEQQANKTVRKTTFYSDDEDHDDESDEESGSESDSESGSEDSDSDSGSGSEPDSGSESDEEDESEEEDSDSSAERVVPSLPKRPPAAAAPAKAAPPVVKAVKGSSSEEESSGEESDTESSSSDDPAPPPPPSKGKKGKAKKPAKTIKAKEEPTNSDLLLDLDFGPDAGGMTAPMMAAAPLLAPTQPGAGSTAFAAGDPGPQIILGVSPAQVSLKTHELLNRITGQGLQVLYRFPRTVSVFSPNMVTCELTFNNTGDSNIQAIKIGAKKLQRNMKLTEFQEIATLAPTNQTKTSLGIDFADTTQPASFELACDKGTFPVSVAAPVGELLQPHTMTEKDFGTERGKLTGMTENSTGVEIPGDLKNDVKALVTRVYETANISQVPTTADNVFLFCGKTVSTSTLTLVTLDLSGDKASLRVNCEKMVIGSMLMKELKAALVK